MRTVKPHVKLHQQNIDMVGEFDMLWDEPSIKIAARGPILKTRNRKWKVISFFWMNWSDIKRAFKVNYYQMLVIIIKC